MACVEVPNNSRGSAREGGEVLEELIDDLCLGVWAEVGCDNYGSLDGDAEDLEVGCGDGF